MKQLTYDEVLKLSYPQLGAIDDPMTLMASGGMAPMAVRYLVRTGQLDESYPGVSLSALVKALTEAAAQFPWPADVTQELPSGSRSEACDSYLSELRPRVRQRLGLN